MSSFSPAKTDKSKSTQKVRLPRIEVAVAAAVDKKTKEVKGIVSDVIGKISELIASSKELSEFFLERRDFYKQEYREYRLPKIDQRNPKNLIFFGTVVVIETCPSGIIGAGKNVKTAVDLMTRYSKYQRLGVLGCDSKDVNEFIGMVAQTKADSETLAKLIAKFTSASQQATAALDKLINLPSYTVRQFGFKRIYLQRISAVIKEEEKSGAVLAEAGEAHAQTDHWDHKIPLLVLSGRFKGLEIMPTFLQSRLDVVQVVGRKAEASIAANIKEERAELRREARRVQRQQKRNQEKGAGIAEDETLNTSTTPSADSANVVKATPKQIPNETVLTQAKQFWKDPKYSSLCDQMALRYSPEEFRAAVNAVRSLPIHGREIVLNSPTLFLQNTADFQRALARYAAIETGVNNLHKKGGALAHYKVLPEELALDRAANTILKISQLQAIVHLAGHESRDALLRRGQESQGLLSKAQEFYSANPKEGSKYALKIQETLALYKKLFPASQHKVSCAELAPESINRTLELLKQHEKILELAGPLGRAMFKRGREGAELLRQAKEMSAKDPSEGERFARNINTALELHNKMFPGHGWVPAALSPTHMISTGRGTQITQIESSIRELSRREMAFDLAQPHDEELFGKKEGMESPLLHAAYNLISMNEIKGAQYIEKLVQVTRMQKEFFPGKPFARENLLPQYVDEAFNFLNQIKKLNNLDAQLKSSLVGIGIKASSGPEDGLADAYLKEFCPRHPDERSLFHSKSGEIDYCISFREDLSEIVDRIKRANLTVTFLELATFERGALLERLGKIEQQAA